MTHDDGGPATAADEPTDRWETSLRQLADQAANHLSTARYLLREHVTAALEIARARNAERTGEMTDPDPAPIVAALRKDVEDWLNELETGR